MCGARLIGYTQYIINNNNNDNNISKIEGLNICVHSEDQRKSERDREENCYTKLPSALQE